MRKRTLVLCLSPVRLDISAQHPTRQTVFKTRHALLSLLMRTRAEENFTTDSTLRRSIPMNVSVASPANVTEAALVKQAVSCTAARTSA